MRAGAEAAAAAGAGAEADAAERAEAGVADAITAPIPDISASAGSDVACPAAEHIRTPPDAAARPERAAQLNGAAEAPADRGPSAAPRAPAQEPPIPQQSARAAAPACWRYRAAAAGGCALVLIAAGSLAFALSRPSARDDHQVSAAVLRSEMARRNTVVAWIASQVSRTAMVSCDQAMCRALAAHGFPAADLLNLQQGTADPLRSAIIVATATVRGQFGSRLSSVYAPGVLASFGSGNLRIDIRAIAPHGAAVYRSELSADLLARKTSGAGLLGSQRIVVSPKARRELSAGQVDSRLLVAIAGMAALHPARIVAFGDSGPGAGARSPLRSAEITAAGSVSNFAVYARSMLTFLRSRSAPFLPAHAGTAPRGGLLVLKIEFAAPSPLGLLNAQIP